jgi:hypothetical protein
VDAVRDLLAFFLVTLVLASAGATGEREVRGRLSMYWPGDSCRTGRVLACDTPRRRRFYEPGSFHVAVRDWWRVGCGTVVRVCVEATGRCVRAPVLDSGPWGAIYGPTRNAKREGRWMIWTHSITPPPPWRFRGHVDVSRAVWVALGRPPFLSRVRIYYPRRGRV